MTIRDYPGDASDLPSPSAALWYKEVADTINALRGSGTTANRPGANRWVGMPYFDTTLGVRIYWTGTDWVDGDGVIV